MAARHYERREKLAVGCVAEYAYKQHPLWYVGVVVVGLHSHES